MTNSSRLAAHRANAPAIEANAVTDDDMDPQTQPTPDEDEDEDESEAGKKKDKPYMTEDEHKAALATARAEGFAEATARANTVLASEHYAGRETLATTMLANDKLSADEIATMLAAAPKAAAPAASDDDAAAREQMREKLAAEQPAPTGQAAEDAPPAQADTTLVDNMKARYGLNK